MRRERQIRAVAKHRKHGDKLASNQNEVRA